MKHNRVKRQKVVISRLQKQLESGVKNTKDGVVKLSDADVKRINKELSTLKSRV